MRAPNTEKLRDIRARTFQFSVRLVGVCRHLEETPGVARTLGRQLLRAGTSIGANVEEAQAGQGKADFINKNAVALKEARETYYWLRLLSATGVLRDEHVSELHGEAQELMRILVAIIVSAKRSSR